MLPNNDTIQWRESKAEKLLGMSLTRRLLCSDLLKEEIERDLKVSNVDEQPKVVISKGLWGFKNIDLRKKKLCQTMAKPELVANTVVTIILCQWFEIYPNI